MDKENTKPEEINGECGCCDSNTMALIGSSLKPMTRRLDWIKTNEGRLVNVKQIVTVWIRNSTPYEVIASTNSSAFPIYSGTLEKCQEAMETLYDCFTLQDTPTMELREEPGPWNPL